MRHSLIAGALLAFTTAAAAVAPLGAAHAETYPSRPVTIVVPFPPGGAGDITARAVAEQLSGELNKTFVVDNTPGANTAIGINALVQAEGNGHTIGIVSSSLPILDLIQPDFTVDFDTGFKPVAMLNRGTLALVVRSDVPAQTFEEFIALAKEKPEEMDAAGAGGATDRLALEMLKSVADLDVMYVPYQGGAAGLTSLLNGETSFGFFPIVTAGPHLQTGDLRALAVTTQTRSELLPDVPTMDEAGITGYADTGSELWWGVVGPAGIPEDVLKRLNAALAEALNSDEIKQQFQQQYVEGWPSTPAEFAEVVRRSHAQWGKVIRDANITPL